MLKPRVSRVVFSTGIAPSESEYFDEINAFKKKALWILLLFVSRTMIPAAGGVQMTYTSIVNDVEGACFVPELRHNNWTYTEFKTITTRYGLELESILRRCEYFDYDYAKFVNISYEDAVKIKKDTTLPKTKICHGGEIFLSPHSSKYHSDFTPFCHARETTRKMLIIYTGSHIAGFLIFGLLGDLFGRKKMATVAAVLWAVCSLCLAVLPKLALRQYFYGISCFFQKASSLLTTGNLP